MTDTNTSAGVHYVSAREHLAGIKAAQQWIQDLTDAHLLRTQQPIRDLPLPSEDQ